MQLSVRTHNLSTRSMQGVDETQIRDYHSDGHSSPHSSSSPTTTQYNSTRSMGSASHRPPLSSSSAASLTAATSGRYFFGTNSHRTHTPFANRHSNASTPHLSQGHSSHLYSGSSAGHRSHVLSVSNRTISMRSLIPSYRSQVTSMGIMSHSGRDSGRVNIPSIRTVVTSADLAAEVDGTVKRNFPYFSIVFVLGICELTTILDLYAANHLIFVYIIGLAFLLGVQFSTSLSWSDLSLHAPISPPNERWWFYTISNFPECNDLRHEFWRLVSAQFVHRK
jgi:hypothetical protein